MRKRSLTLIEIVVAMFLLGILLAGLFNFFYATLKKNIAAKELKQKTLRLELFQLHMKNVLAKRHIETGVWTDSHPDALGQALFFPFEATDPDPDMSGGLLGMLYLNRKKELCFASWGAQGKGRNDVLLDKVDSFTCRLFDPKEAVWTEKWTNKNEEDPVMASIKLNWEGVDCDFAFFLGDSTEEIVYQGSL